LRLPGGKTEKGGSEPRFRLPRSDSIIMLPGASSGAQSARVAKSFRWEAEAVSEFETDW